VSLNPAFANYAAAIAELLATSLHRMRCYLAAAYR
jgi:hypothetical protein